MVDYIKQEIYKERDRREVFIVVIGMKSDLNTRQAQRSVTGETGLSVAKGEIIDATTIASYMHAEKLTHFECSVTNRGSLSRPVMELVARMTQPVQKTGLLGSRRTRSGSEN